MNVTPIFLANAISYERPDSMSLILHTKVWFESYESGKENGRDEMVHNSLRPQYERHPLTVLQTVSVYAILMDIATTKSIYESTHSLPNLNYVSFGVLL